MGRADRRPRLGQAEYAHRQRVARRGPGQRQSGRRDPLAARRDDGRDRGVLWKRVNRGWRPLLAAYVIVMAFALVYAAEHYVIDILLGWALAAGVMLTMHWFRTRRKPSPEEAEIQPIVAAHS